MNLSRLRVSDNGRFLVQEDGTPFFWLGDTAWMLFHRLDLEDAERYMQDRVDKRFTVLQAVALTEVLGLETPNAYGHKALIDDDPLQPNEPYFRHIDAVLERAAAHGLYVALLPAWGSYVVGDSRPAIFDVDTAHRYGAWIGERYRAMPHLIWVMGGDRLPISRGVDYTPVWRAMARGVQEGYGPQALMTWHPRGGGLSSSLWFHGDDWLDFDMMQSGPRRNLPNYARIATDYRQQPPKPTLDGEPGYERALHRQNPNNPRLSAHDVRKYAYWALFAGAFGHTYGCLEVWQMYTDAYERKNGAEMPWQQALDLPGAQQMRHARALIESRPFLSRVPDRRLVVRDEGYVYNHVQATRDADGSYALVYIPTGKPTEIDLERLSGERLVVHWYNPRTGAAAYAGEVRRRGAREFTPPASGPEEDWVLALEDVERGYPAPGASVWTGAQGAQ